MPQVHESEHRPYTLFPYRNGLPVQPCAHKEQHFLPIDTLGGLPQQPLDNDFRSVSARGLRRDTTVQRAIAHPTPLKPNRTQPVEKTLSDTFRFGRAFAVTEDGGEGAPPRRMFNRLSGQFELNPFWGAYPIQRAAAIFTGGFALGFAGAWGWEALQKRLTSSGITQSAKEAGEAATEEGKRKLPLFFPEEARKNQTVMNDHLPSEGKIWFNFQEAFVSLLQLYNTVPVYRNALKAYALTTATGYVANEVASGAQEAWVRQQEAKIRFNLLSCMTAMFRTTIQLKQQHDVALHQLARRRIHEILQQATQAGLLNQSQVQAVEEVPKHGSEVNPLNRYIFEPFHLETASDKTPEQWANPFNLAHQAQQRQAHQAQRSQAMHFGEASRILPQAPNNFSQSAFTSSVTAPALDNATMIDPWPATTGQARPTSWADWGIGGLGMMMGASLKVLVSAFNDKGLESARQRTVHESMFTAGAENLFLLATDKTVLIGSLLLIGLTRLGQLLVGAMKEVEVTRVNARTEYDYQQYKMEYLDPTFHRIAEQEALDTRLNQFMKDLPELAKDTPALKKRVQDVYTKIGLFSAPKYWPMSPAVALVEARS